MNSISLLLGLFIVLCGHGCDLPSRDTRIGDGNPQIGNVRSDDSVIENRFVDSIYSVLLTQGNYKNEFGVDVILDVTISGEEPRGNELSHILEVNKVRTEEVGEDLRNDFIRTNQVPSKFVLPTELKDKYRLVSREELRSVFSNSNGWSEFHNRFPKAGLIEFSKVGFNKEMTKALVYKSTTSGMRNGEADYYVLIRRGEIWTIESKINAWLS